MQPMPKLLNNRSKRLHWHLVNRYRCQQRGIVYFKTITEHSEQDWDLLYDVLVKDTPVTQKSVEVMRRRGFGVYHYYCK
jgi:hypothetical protein